MGYTIKGYPLEELLASAKSAPKGHKVPVEILIEALKVAIALEKNQVTFINQKGEKYTRINNIGTLNL